MKSKRGCIIILFVFVFAIFSNAIDIKAMNTGFSTEEITEEDKNRFISNINISLLSVEPVKKGVLCFDVNERGMIAVCQEDDSSKKICIYSTNGKFLYGYSFNCSQSCAVEWDKEYINIYFVRSDVIISLDSECKIIDIRRVQDTIANNTHRNYLLSSTRREIGDVTYQIRNDMGIFNWIALSYSQIVTVDSAGIETIIYDVNSNQFLIIVAISVIIFVFVSGVIVGVVREFFKLRSGVQQKV